MKILGATLPRTATPEGPLWTLVSVDGAGGVDEIARPQSMPELVTEVGRLAGDEPFLLGVDAPVVVPARKVRSRTVDNVVRKRLGHRLEPGGRAALSAMPEAVSGESLLAALAASGHACLGFPERDRRTSGLAEIHPALVLKSLLWQGARMAEGVADDVRGELFRAYGPPSHHGRRGRTVLPWAERVAAADLVLRALGGVTGYDLQAVRDALTRATSDADTVRVAALFDAVLIAGTLLRYLDSPELCVFVGERETGYTILPADPFVRRLALRDAGPERTPLFPHATLRERLGPIGTVRSLDLLEVRGKPQRLEATFREPPLYEFDNVDEMLWWKHCRHVAGPAMPVDGLQELVVTLDPDAEDGRPLRLTRSRHRTLSFRFDPPDQWRTRIATRDGKIYPFRVLRAVYEAI